jgi:hypothetical protein
VAVLVAVLVAGKEREKIYVEIVKEKNHLNSSVET